jgi:hypothetical protein
VARRDVPLIMMIAYGDAGTNGAAAGSVPFGSMTQRPTRKTIFIQYFQ